MKAGPELDDPFATLTWDLSQGEKNSVPYILIMRVMRKRESMFS